MARILTYTSPARGHLYPVTPILDELRRRGHQIVVRTLASEVASMRARGFAAAPISRAVEAIEHDDWHSRQPRAALASTVRVFCRRAVFDAADLQHAIGAEQPDALLVDVSSWGGLTVAEAWGGPWATFCPYPLPLSSPDVAPYGPGLAPSRGPLGRLRDRLVRPVVVGTIEKTMMPAVNDVRGSSGLRPVASIDDWFQRIPVVLYLTAEPFEYPRGDWPSNVVLVGPCAWEPAAAAPAWLAAVGDPIVLVTTSSEYQNDGRLVQAAIEALANEPVHVVATMPAGDRIDGDLPANAHVERFLSHSAILGRAVCAITHGGMGATQKALAHGVPVCVVPFGRDQLEVARRVVVAGAGTRLAARRLTVKRLRTKVREAMTRVAGAQRLAAAFAATGGPVAAADAFESRLL